jgi:hypothetical protein
MTHEEAIDLVHAGHDRPLDESARDSLEAHLAECEHCRGVAQTYGVIHDVLQEELRHLAVDEVVSYATDRDGRTPEERGRVEAHVGACTTCADEVARVERVHASVAADPAGRGASGAKRRRWSTPGAWLAVAASLVAAALLYPAYLGLSRTPSDLDSLGGWSGPADLELIAAGLRDAGEARVVEIEPGRPFVLFGIQVAITGEVPDDAAVRFEILDAEGRSAAEMRLTAVEVREQVRSAGVVSWLVAAGELEEGDYALRVDLSEGNRLIEAPLSVRVADLASPVH